jgi:hypothetical protein
VGGPFPGVRAARGACLGRLRLGRSLSLQRLGTASARSVCKHRVAHRPARPLCVAPRGEG